MANSICTGMKEISIVACVNLVTQVSQTIDIINDTTQLGELKNTMNFVITSLMPYMDVEKHDTVFYICTHSLIQSLNLCKQILLEAYNLQPTGLTQPQQPKTCRFSSFSSSCSESANRCGLNLPNFLSSFISPPSCNSSLAPTTFPPTSSPPPTRSTPSTSTLSHDRKIELYRTDFLINHKILQFMALFPPNSSSSSLESLLTDPEARLFWTTCFSDTAIMVPWKQFFTSFEKYLHICLESDEDYFKNFLDFTQDNFVSAFEFSMFIRWFGPMKGCNTRLMDPVNQGMLAGFIPACEATNLLVGRETGTFLVRLSKSHLDSFAITFVDPQLQIRHCLLYCACPHGLTLNHPPNIFPSLTEFVRSHPHKLKTPLGKLIVSASCKARVRVCYKPCDVQNGQVLGDVSAGPGRGVAPYSNDREDFVNCTTSPGLPSVISSPSPPSYPTTTTSTHDGCSAISACTVSQQKDYTSESCVVCLDAPSQTVFLECGHMCCCKICSVKLKHCPMCRTEITRVIPVYRT